MQELAILSAVHALSFAPDGRYLAVSGVAAPCVQIHDLIDGSVIDLPGHTGVYAHVSFAPRGSLLAVQGATLFEWDGESRSARLLNPDPGFAGTFDAAGFAGTFDATGERLVFSARGAGNQPPLYLIDTPDLDRQRELTRGPFLLRVNRLAWSPDGEWLGTSGTRADAHRILSAQSGAFFGPIQLPPQIAYNLAFRPDSEALAFATAVGVHVFAVPSGTPLHTLTEHHGLVSGVAYTPDGRLLSCGNDSRVLTWDGISGRLLEAHDWQVGPLTTLTIAPDGMRAAVGSKSGRIFVWDLD
jgi:WD40 repeat protein